MRRLGTTLYCLKADGSETTYMTVGRVEQVDEYRDAHKRPSLRQVFNGILQSRRRECLIVTMKENLWYILEVRERLKRSRGCRFPKV